MGKKKQNKTEKKQEIPSQIAFIDEVKRLNAKKGLTDVSFYIFTQAKGGESSESGNLRPVELLGRLEVTKAIHLKNALGSVTT
jgi:hypothetical protein